MTNKEIKKIINQLKTHELDIRYVPEEITYDKEIINAERKFGLRKEGNRGYDAIHRLFFVEEEITWFNFSNEANIKKEQLTFDTIEDFYEYLDGDIYTQACYKFCDLNKFKQFIKKNKIDINKLQERDTFLEKTIDDDFKSPITNEEIVVYDEIEEKKKLIKSWIKKFDKCKTGQDLCKIVDRFDKSELHDTIDVLFFFYYYIFQEINNEERFTAVMEYMCTGRYPEDKMTRALCSIYGTERVLERYNYSAGSTKTNYNRKHKLKEYIELLATEKIVFNEKCYFDNNTHYYCKCIEGYIDEYWRPIVSYQQYFETFEEFIKNQNGSLRNTDLSSALKLDIDFKSYKIDDTTKLPISSLDKLNCEINKYYEDDKFIVNIERKTKDGYSTKEYKFSTPYFFDFVYYLHGDLSNANLLFCDGLVNINSYDNIVFSGARLKSELCEKFGVKYKPIKLNASLIESFSITEKNEKETAFLLTKHQDSDLVTEENKMSLFFPNIGYDAKSQRIYYITDLHLMHRLKNARCKSINDIIYTIQKIVDTIAKDACNVLLIGGDISSEYTIFEIFIKLLKNKMDECSLHTDVIFVLGNHELWSFPDKNIEQIISIYREAIESNGMYLLQNELIYRNSIDELCKIPFQKLKSLSIEELKNELKNTRLVIFGGIGFSGYNEEFNANQGIYKTALNRNDEISESIKFEALYNQVLPVIKDKNSIIFTHMPKKDWAKDSTLQKNLVYVSGHAHRNEFHDDGDYRIYSDNQIGYRNNDIQLKNFLVDSDYDYFEDYLDGIYEINSEQYNDFYRGKNIQMSFSREINILYMLKKNGYYCFIHKGKNGQLTILNGGALRQLENKDVNYYYEHMDLVISYIKGPLDKYMNKMHKISDEIIKIGGTGKIHGCIVDINWFNHIYVNPIDLTITGYFALNIIDKIVYPSISTLLKTNCPELYDNYLKRIGKDKNNPLAPIKIKKEVECMPEEYLSTNIYIASREIKKMQKLGSNILSYWYETSTADKKQLPNNAKKIK